MLFRSLRADPSKFQSKSAQSVRSRVGNIRSFLKEDMNLPAFWQYLKSSFGGEGLESGSLTQEELAAVQALKENKYDTWEWTYGRSPHFTFINKRKWPGGVGRHTDFHRLRLTQRSTKHEEGYQKHVHINHGGKVHKMCIRDRHISVRPTGHTNV